MKIHAYGLDWEDADELDIEMKYIRNGGYFEFEGVRTGKGLPFHYERMRKLLWPRLDDHRWHRLCRDSIASHKITVLLGPASSGKTHEASWLFLCEYFCFPQETCVLVSSTDIRGLRLRAWAEIAGLWQEAVERYPKLAGHLLDSRIAITTDELPDGDYEDRKVRDMRKGIIGIPTIQGGKFVGLAKWIGCKQKRMRLIGDEFQMMGPSMLSAFSNLNKNEDFKAVVIGNPNDPLDPLGKAAEPIDGWSSHLEPAKTCTWKTRFMEGICVNLIGTDSPNFDKPPENGKGYKYLIDRKKIDETVSFFGKDSYEYYSQCVGSMKTGLLEKRILTREICEQHHALEPVIWDGSDTVKVCGMDSAYGGDRCVCGHVEFGKDNKGNQILKVMMPQIVPVSLKNEMSAEDQISEWVKNYCENEDIKPSNFFHDSTGRGALGTALGRAWSSDCNPIEFGGAPTDRPVSNDLYKTDEETGQRRLVRCNEHYDRFVSELAYQVRYAVESDQIRGLPEEVMDELCMREWERKKGEKLISIETKQLMKKRVGRSPDLADWLAICLEGARRLGFVIQRIPSTGQQQNDNEWLLKELRSHRQEMKKRELHYH